MRYLSLFLVPFFLVACVKRPIEPRADVFGGKQIYMASDNLRNNTAVGQPSVARDDVGQLLYITVPIRSASNLRLYVDYRVVFFDAAGIEISKTGWFTKTLEPNVPDSITVNSTSPRAADFRIDFRYAK